MAFDPATAALELGKSLVTHFFPDPAQQATAQLELEKLHQSGELAGMLAQTAIDQIEATNVNWFVAGWRPFIGWICGLGLCYQFLFYPLAIATMPKIVQLDMGTLLALLGGMLGLGGLRTAEKFQGVAR